MGVSGEAQNSKQYVETLHARQKMAIESIEEGMWHEHFDTAIGQSISLHEKGNITFLA